MAFDIPAGVPSMGTRRLVFLETPPADIKAITLAELTSGVDLSCYILRTGLTKSVTENKVTDSRYCSSQDFQRFGSKSKEMSLAYSVNFGSATDDVARVTLEEGAEGVLVELFQVDEDAEAFVGGEWYQATPIQVGEQNIPPVEDNAIDRIEQGVAVTGAWTKFHQIQPVPAP